MCTYTIYILRTGPVLVIIMTSSGRRGPYGVTSARRPSTRSAAPKARGQPVRTLAPIDVPGGSSRSRRLSRGRDHVRSVTTHSWPPSGRTRDSGGSDGDDDDAISIWFYTTVRPCGWKNINSFCADVRR